LPVNGDAHLRFYDAQSGSWSFDRTADVVLAGYGAGPRIFVTEQGGQAMAIVAEAQGPDATAGTPRKACLISDLAAPSPTCAPLPGVSNVRRVEFLGSFAILHGLESGSVYVLDLSNPNGSAVASGGDFTFSDLFPVPGTTQVVLLHRPTTAAPQAL